jgi:signal transduction histidine kinase
MRQRSEALREAQRRRLEALARAGAGLAHQLRTPLATIKGSCQLMGEQLEQSPQRARLQAAISQADRMERMLGMLLDFARPPAPQPRPVEVRAMLQEVTAHRSRVQLGRIDNAVASADPEHLTQIVDNLVNNAEAFSPSGEMVEVAAALERNRVEIIVADRGPGPGPDPEEHFQPYITTRADGTGLGLAIARTLAEANDGDLILQPRKGGGCEAVLSLPAVRGNS